MYSPWHIFKKLQTITDRDEMINFIKSIPRKEPEPSFYVVKSSKGYWDRASRSWQEKSYNADWYSSEIFAEGICEVVQSHEDIKVWVEEVED